MRPTKIKFINGFVLHPRPRLSESWPSLLHSEFTFNFHIFLQLKDFHSTSGPLKLLYVLDSHQQVRAVGPNPSFHKKQAPLSFAASGIFLMMGDREQFVYSL